MGLSSGYDQAMDYINTGYSDAKNYMNPYYQGGLADYNSYRDYVGNMGKTLAPYQNAGQQQWDQINQSPQDYYNSIMSGYTTSPQAQNQMNSMYNATNQGASASGMYGSSAYNNDLQQNANNITAGDQQQYFGNVQNTNNMQMQDLQNLQQQQAAYRNSLGGLADMGFNSAGAMGHYSTAQASQLAQLQAQKTMAQAMQHQQLLNNIFSGAGGVAGMATQVLKIPGVSKGLMALI